MEAVVVGTKEKSSRTEASSLSPVRATIEIMRCDGEGCGPCIFAWTRGHVKEREFSSKKMITRVAMRQCLNFCVYEVFKIALYL